MGIYQKRFNTLQIQPETDIGERDQVITAAKTLTFYPEMDGEIIGGVSRIIVSIGDDGEIYEISKYYRDFVKAGSKEVISVDTALEKVRHGDAAFTLGETVEHAVLTNAALTYWEDSGDIHVRSYLRPVWVFEGKSLEVPAENAQFQAMVPALKWKELAELKSVERKSK